jgi:SAM-dependent methyltransferase
MKGNDNLDFPSGGINRYVYKYIRELPELAGKTVLDIPCGDGRASYEFMKKGATVKAFDLYPSSMKLKEVKAEYADLSDTLPVGDGTVDYVICQEGIEHIPNQLKVFREFNRILKVGGVLLITTPSYSHVRARLSHLFLESDFWKRMPPTEIDSMWLADKGSDKLYFGHLFLLGVQHLQTLLSISGFKVDTRVKTDIGKTSLILGLILYPIFALVTFLSWMFYRTKNKHISQKDKDRILWGRLKLNLSPKTMFCKHIFWVLSKQSELDEVILRIKNLNRDLT